MGIGSIDIDALIRAVFLGVGAGMCTTAIGYFVTKPPIERTRSRHTWILGGSGVALVLSTIVYFAWPTLVRVPQLAEQSQAEAEDLVAKLRLRSEVRPQYSTSTEQGRVIPSSQDPSPGVMVRPGTLVAFAVSLRRAILPLDTPLMARGNLKITDPTPNGSAVLLRSGDGIFHLRVLGATSDVRLAEQRIVLWVHPVNPPSDTVGWYLQRPPASGVLSIATDGSWVGMVQIGNSTFPPKPGHVIDVAASIVDNHTYDKLFAESGVVLRPEPTGEISAAVKDVVLSAGRQK